MTKKPYNLDKTSDKVFALVSPHVSYKTVDKLRSIIKFESKEYANTVGGHEKYTEYLFDDGDVISIAGRTIDKLRS